MLYVAGGPTGKIKVSKYRRLTARTPPRRRWDNDDDRRHQHHHASARAINP